MATAEAAVAQAHPQHYLWSFPGAPVKVHLSLQVVGRLKDRLEMIAHGGPEEGLLLGRNRDGATEILDFQPTANCDLTQMISALKPDQERSLVGYYRTEESAAFRLTPKDRSLADQCFAKPHQVFLLVHWSGYGPPNATFFFRGSDGRMGDLAFLEFPFDTSVLAVEERDRLRRSQQAASEQAANTPPRLRAQPPAKDRRRGRKIMAGAVWAGSLALVFALGMLINTNALSAWFTRSWRTLTAPAPSAVPAPPHRSMSLHAARQGNDFVLTWNREAPLITNATSGLISIQDGEAKRLVALDATELRGGSLLYSPTSDQLLMQLTVVSQAETVTESVVVLVPKSGTPETYAVPPASVISHAVPASAAKPIPAPPVQASRPFVLPPEQQSASSAKPGLEEPPALNPQPAASAALSDPLSAPLVIPSAAAPPQPARPAAPSPAASSPARVVPEQYEPPVALTKIPPGFPRELASIFLKPVTVRVTVSIDKYGHVIKAEAPAQPSLNKLLVNAAVGAARLWKFQPARLNGVPVPSEMVVQFVFSR